MRLVNGLRPDRFGNGMVFSHYKLPEVLESRLTLGILDPRRRVDASPQDKGRELHVTHHTPRIT